MGRFISADTIVQAPYDPQSLNRYSYCRNNPINYIDPSGHFLWFAPLIAAIIGAGVGAAVAAATGGNIGAGAIWGAISGALFWGAGQAIGGIAGAMNLQSTAAMTVLTAGMHTLAGGASGALGALATGGDVGASAAIGGISAGVSAIVGGVFPIPGDGIGAFIGRGVQRTLVGAILGGGTALVMGGTFGEGAALGAMSSAIGYTCNEALHEVQERVVALYRGFDGPGNFHEGIEITDNYNEYTGRWDYSPWSIFGKLDAIRLIPTLGWWTVRTGSFKSLSFVSSNLAQVKAAYNDVTSKVGKTDVYWLPGVIMKNCISASEGVISRALAVKADEAR